MTNTLSMLHLTLAIYFALYNKLCEAQGVANPVASNLHSDDEGPIGALPGEPRYRDRWHYVYSDEYDSDHYRVKTIEKRLDMRVANVLQTINDIGMVDKYHHRFDYDNPDVRSEYESYINGPEVDQKLCREHLIEMNSLLDELDQINSYQRSWDRSELYNSSALELSEEHILLARALDSYGRYESGVLDGRADLIGSWEQCLETKLKLRRGPARQVVATRYCKAGFGFKADLDPKIRTNSHVYIQVGVCLPNTCHSDSLKDNKPLIQRLVNSQFTMPESIYVKKHRQVEYLFCINDHNTSIGLPWTGKLFVLAASIWIILLISATYYADTWKLWPSRSMRIIARSFNVKESIHDFLDHHKGEDKSDEEQRASRVHLDNLNAVKFVAMSIVILFHSFFMEIFYVPDFLRASSDMTKTPLKTLFFGFNPFIDTFFMISGLLFSYWALKKHKTILESNPSFDQICRISAVLFTNRYLRLVPLYFIAFWFKKSVLIYLGSGPMWDHGFNQNTPYGHCKRETWLTPFTPAAAYLRFDHQCLYQTWSIGCEIFFLFLTVPVTVIIAMKPKLGVMISLVLGLASSAMMYAVLFKVDPLDLREMNGFYSDALRLTFQDPHGVYKNAHLRLASIFGGVVCGYILYCYERNIIKSWPDWFTNHASKLAIITVLFDIFIYYTIPLCKRYELYRIANPYVHLQVTIRICWASANCVLLLRWVTDYKDTIAVRLLTGKFVNIMCKINYAALLIHVDILYIKYIHSKTYLPDHSSKVDIALVCYVYSFAIGALIHVLIEGPINKLRQAIMSPGKKDLKKRN